MQSSRKGVSKEVKVSRDHKIQREVSKESKGRFQKSQREGSNVVERVIKEDKGGDIKTCPKGFPPDGHQETSNKSTRGKFPASTVQLSIKDDITGQVLQHIHKCARTVRCILKNCNTDTTSPVGHTHQVGVCLTHTTHSAT